MNLHKYVTPLKDVLYQFALAKRTPDAEVLDEFVRRYPEHAGALTDLAIGIVLDQARGDDDQVAESFEPVVSETVDRAMSRFQNRLSEVQLKPATSTHEASEQSAPVENPFATLDRSEFRALANRLNCNTVFVGMLRDRQIEPKTMSIGFTRRIADELKVPPELVAAHFAAQSEEQRGQYYKAGDKPRTGPKVSFEEAVRKSGLTKEQQNYLLSL